MTDTQKALFLGALAGSLVVVGMLRGHEEQIFAIKRANCEVQGVDWDWADIREQGDGSWFRGFFLTPPTSKNLHTGQLERTSLYPLGKFYRRFA